MIESRIKEIAASRGIRSSYGLQKALGIAPSNAIRLWNEKVTRFSVEILDKLCESFGVSVGDLLVYRKGKNDTESVIQNKDSISVNTSNVVEMPVSIPANSKQQLDQSETEKPASQPETPGTTASEGDLLTVEQAAKLLNRSPRQVRTYAKGGALIGKQGKQSHWFFNLADVEDYKRNIG
jgi:DNA-binding Xre family transcriptional regulator